jgi:hypothetical protein
LSSWNPFDSSSGVQAVPRIAARFATFVRLFRAEAFAAEKLAFYSQLCELSHPVHFQEWTAGPKQLDWVVCVRPPFRGA